MSLTEWLIAAIILMFSATIVSLCLVILSDSYLED